MVDPDATLIALRDGGALPQTFSSVCRKPGSRVGTLITLLFFSMLGFHQGCALATHGSCLPQHIKLGREVQPRFPTSSLLSYGDDTFHMDHGSRLYEAAVCRERACAALGHSARRDKELCFSAQGDLAHAPRDLPGSPRHRDGRLEGFKAVGCYFGDPNWARQQMLGKMVKSFKPLDRVDAMRDAEGVENSRQVRSHLMKHVANGLPNHWLRSQRYTLTTTAPCGADGDAIRDEDGWTVPSMTSFIDGRTSRSFESLADAGHSPPDRRACAIQQARLPEKLGGAGLSNTSATAAAINVASRLQCWPRMAERSPLFASVDPLTHAHPWFAELRSAYADLRARHQAVTGVYQQYKTELLHYCDGDTTRPRFRPADLPSLEAVPPLSCIIGPTSDKKPPPQRRLVSIVHHEGWLASYRANRSADADPNLASQTDRLDRESTRLVAASQPFAGAWLALLPVEERARIVSSEFLWAYQRRFGLHLSQPAAIFLQLQAVAGVQYDALGDTITTEPQTDRSLPHDSALRVVHDASQASASHAVVLGDKEHPEITEIYNTGCAVDLAESLMGKGGSDLCLEMKAYSDLLLKGSSGEYETSVRGSTHAFGNTEERLIRSNVGVRAQGAEGDERWNPDTGSGRVAHKQGVYDDAIRVKRNTFVLFLVNHFGGLAPGAVRHMYTLTQRARRLDRTLYPLRGATKYLPYWTQLLSAAIVTADARRCPRKLRAWLRA